MKVKKIGLVGIGRMGSRHVIAINQLKKAKLVAVCDFKKNKLKKHFVKKYYDYSKMMSLESIDLLVIATHASSHFPIIKSAIKHGIRKILCEKPLASSLAEAKEIVKLCKKKKVRIATNHSRRWVLSYQKLKKLISKGVIGKIRNINFEMGGGQIGSNGSHVMDLIRYLTNEEPKKVLGKIDKNRKKNPRGKTFIDPGGYGMFILNDGSRMFVDMSEDYGLPFFVKVMGTYGRILIDEKSKRWEIYTRPKKFRKLALTKRVKLNKIKFTGESIDQIKCSKQCLKELLSNKKIQCTAYDGYKSLEMSVGIHNSNFKNNFITFPVSKIFFRKKFNFA